MKILLQGDSNLIFVENMDSFQNEMINSISFFIKQNNNFRVNPRQWVDSTFMVL